MDRTLIRCSVTLYHDHVAVEYIVQNPSVQNVVTVQRHNKTATKKSDKPRGDGHLAIAGVVDHYNVAPCTTAAQNTRNLLIYGGTKDTTTW